MNKAARVRTVTKVMFKPVAMCMGPVVTVVLADGGSVESFGGSSVRKSV